VIKKRPKLFEGRHFQDVIIILCVRWYLHHSLSYRDLKEMMAERGRGSRHRLDETIAHRRAESGEQTEQHVAD
jgi:transposase-like protein